MERGLRPEKLEVLPTSPDAARIFKHWLFIFSRFKETLEGSSDACLGVLANSLSSENFEIIADCDTYDGALEALKRVFIQPANEVVARHRLSSKKQSSGESIDEFLRSLYKLSVDCNFRAVSAETYRDEYIRDAFISGLSSLNICTQLLENKSVDLSTAVAQARALEIASKDSLSYDALKYPCSVVATQETAAKISSEISSSSDVLDDICSSIDNKKTMLFLWKFSSSQTKVSR